MLAGFRAVLYLFPVEPVLLLVAMTTHPAAIVVVPVVSGVLPQSAGYVLPVPKKHGASARYPSREG